MKDRKTGDIVDDYGPHDNMVVDTGINTMWLRLSNDDNSEQYLLDSIHLGSDYGDPERWSIFNPEPPSRGFTSDNQTVTHVLSPQFDFPSDEVIKVFSVVDGQEMMNSHFPDQISYDFSSATLRFNNQEVFAFKRFPIRSISRSVIAEFDWRFRIINAEEWCDNE